MTVTLLETELDQTSALKAFIAWRLEELGRVEVNSYSELHDVLGLGDEVSLSRLKRAVTSMHYNPLNDHRLWLTREKERGPFSRTTGLVLTAWRSEHHNTLSPR